MTKYFLYYRNNLSSRIKKKKSLFARKKIVLSLNQEKNFLASKVIAVGGFYEQPITQYFLKMLMGSKKLLNIYFCGKGEDFTSPPLLI